MGGCAFWIFQGSFDQLQRCGLFFIQEKLRIGHELLRAMRIARHRLLAQLGKAAPNERAKSGIIERHLAQKVRRRERRGELRDRLEQLGLARGASAQLFHFLRRSGTDQTDEKLLFPADLGPPDDLREDASHHGFDRTAIVIRHPASEFDQSRAHDWFFA